MTRPCYPAIRFFTLAVLLTCTLIGSSASGQTGGFTLPSGCTLPFDNIATKPDPFQKCGNCGVVSNKSSATELQAKALQSGAKNNFCADTSQVTSVDFATLRTMGANAASLDVPDLPSRQKLHGFYSVNGKSIGEGDVVRLVAWIASAHVSDCSSTEHGEEVNCETLGFVNNDLHIPLLDPAGDRTQDECTSVTAEISPHFRPAAWSDLDLKTPVKNVVRMTGPLFYDNAHKPCLQPYVHTSAANKGRAPFRSTLWEIHPVYKMEVCANSDASKCDVNSDDATMWVAYDKWVSLPANAGAIAATGAEQRKSCPTGGAQSGYVPNKCVSDVGGNSTQPTKKKKKTE